MADPIAGEVTQKPNSLKTTLDVSITMSFITASEYWGTDDDMWPKLTRIFAPLIGLIISGIVVYFIKNYEDNKDEERVQGYIDSLETKINVPGLSPVRRRALLAEQGLHQQDLGEIRRKRTKRRMLNWSESPRTGAFAIFGCPNCLSEVAVHLVALSTTC